MPRSPCRRRPTSLPPWSRRCHSSSSPTTWPPSVAWTWISRATLPRASRWNDGGRGQKTHAPHPRTAAVLVLDPELRAPGHPSAVQTNRARRGVGNRATPVPDGDLHARLRQVRPNLDRRHALSAVFLQRAHLLELLRLRDDPGHPGHDLQRESCPQDLLSPRDLAHCRPAVLGSRSRRRVRHAARSHDHLWRCRHVDDALGAAASGHPGPLRLRPHLPHFGGARLLPRYWTWPLAGPPALDVRDPGGLSIERRSREHPAPLSAEPHGPHHRRLPAGAALPPDPRPSPPWAHPGLRGGAPGNDLLCLQTGREDLRRCHLEAGGGAGPGLPSWNFSNGNARGEAGASPSLSQRSAG